MPELPEVETVRTDLVKNLKGKKILDVEVKVAKMASPRPPLFEKKVIGQKILDISRRGKLLIFKLPNIYMLAHLKMTGQFVFLPKKGKLVFGGHTIAGLNETPNKYTHFVFTMENGILYFNDLRKFGYFKLVSPKELNEILKNYGIDPLAKEFTIKTFQEILLKKPNAKIKQILMDQKLIAGIGNIYADEICFYAKVLPERQAKSLADEEIKLLFSGIKKILQKAVEERGTSVNTYVDGNGKKGNYAKFLKVYQQEGKKCLRCKKGIIKRMKMGGRSTHFCTECQK